jgi:hypothetical protein
MNKFSKIIQKFFLIFVLAGISTTSLATQIAYTNTYTNEISTTGIGTVFSSTSQSVLQNSITPFDSTLGTLKDIEITIYGDIIYGGLSGSSYTQNEYGQIFSFPYIILSTFDLGINGFNGDFFTLGNDMEVTKLMISTGLFGGGPISDATSFSFTFDYSDSLNQFTAPSDVMCSTCNAISPPYTMDGGLDGFIDDATLNEMLQFNYQLSFYSSGQTGIVTPSILTATSIVHIDTTYTYDEPLPQTVPEPPTLLLTLTGLILMLKTRRARCINTA